MCMTCGSVNNGELVIGAVINGEIDGSAASDGMSVVTVRVGGVVLQQLLLLLGIVLLCIVQWLGYLFCS